jgi:ParB/RepB/Spo0J family partition protein
MTVKYEKVPKLKVKIRAKPQARQAYDQAELERLADSLLTGQLQAIGLLSDFTLIWGERRWRAAMLRDEITHLLAVVFDKEISESEFLLMRATENFQRSDLTAYEKWLTCQELLEANPQWQQKDLAAAMKLDQSAITKLLSPAKCSQGWRDALKAGKVGIGDCYAASGLPDAEQAALLAQKLAGASRDAIAQAARKSRSGQKPAGKLSRRIKVELPSGISVIASGTGLSLEAMIASLAEVEKLAKKALADGLDAKSFQVVTKQKNSKRSAA